MPTLNWPLPAEVQRQKDVAKDCVNEMLTEAFDSIIADPNHMIGHFDMLQTLFRFHREAPEVFSVFLFHFERYRKVAPLNKEATDGYGICFGE